MNARVGGTPVLITDNNYRVLQFIDLCSSKRYYGWENAERRILDFAESHDIKQKDVIMYLDYYTQTTQKAVLKILEKFI